MTKTKHWTDESFVHIPYHKSVNPWTVPHHCRPERHNQHIILEIMFDFLCKPASIFLRGYIRNPVKRRAYKLENIPKIRILIFKLMKVPFNILNGRNCEYPPRDTALYIMELLRKDGL